MTEADSIKWALLDLLKVLDAAHGGQMHRELSRIARSLGVELPEIVVATLEQADGALASPPRGDLEQWAREKLAAASPDNWKAEQARKMKAPRN